MNRVVFALIGTAGLVAAAYLARNDLFFLRKSSSEENERRRNQAMLAPNPRFVTPAIPPAVDPITRLSGQAPRTGNALCAEFFNRIFSEDFRSISAERMNHLPDLGGCRTDAELVNQVLAKYEAACRPQTIYSPDYAAWNQNEKNRAALCLTWIWLVRSAVVADRMKGMPLNQVTDVGTLNAWLFGALLSMDVDTLSSVAARLTELDPHSLTGAKGVLMKRAIEIAKDEEKTGSKLDEAFWSDSEREWRRARELGPNDPELDIVGVLIRTRGMDLPRLKYELNRRQGPEFEGDPTTHYLRAYYASKTGKKEDAIPLLEAAAQRFPKEAKRFADTAESCRTKDKCSFQMSMGIRFDNLFRVDDIVH